MSAADQHNLREVFEEFWRALDDVEDHLRIVHNTAWPGDWWEGRDILLEIHTVLEEEIGKVLDARKRLHVLAPTVAAHVIAPPGQTGEQWVLEALALGDEAHRLAEEEYGHCTIYRGPMDPDLIVENRNDQELRKHWTDTLRQIEEDYQRVSCGLQKAREHLNRVVSVLLPPTAETEEVTVSTAGAGAGHVPATPTDKKAEVAHKASTTPISACRPAYGRDHLWLRWKNEESMTPAPIRDRWNGMTDEERRKICPRKWQCIESDGGREGECDLVEKGLRKAAAEEAATGEN